MTRKGDSPRRGMGHRPFVRFKEIEPVEPLDGFSKLVKAIGEEKASEEEDKDADRE